MIDIIIFVSILIGITLYAMPKTKKPNALKIEEYFKKTYPESFYCSTKLLGHEEDYEVYGVSSKTQELMKGGGKWNYYKFFENGKIEEFEVKPNDKYWKSPEK